VTLPALAAADIDRQLVRGARSYRSISAARAQPLTSRTPMLMSIDETDGRTPYTDPAPRMRAASKEKICPL